MQTLCGLQGIFDLFNCKTPGLAWKSKRGESLAVRRFMEYLDYR